MLLDKLNSIRFPEIGSIQKYLKKIEDIILHLKDVGYSIFESNSIKCILYTLPAIYKRVVSAQIGYLNSKEYF